MIKKLILTCAACTIRLLAMAQLPLSIIDQNSGLNNLNRLATAYSIITNYYVDEVNETKIVDDAISDILKRLDPHSAYITKDDVQEANEQLVGNFEGIGVTYQMLEDTLFVISTISGAPAEKVGVVAGDRIISANDTSIVGLKTSEIQKHLRGPKGTVVQVKVVRRGVREVMTFDITRDKIPLYSVDAAYIVSPEVGYIRINKYSKSTIDEYIEAYDKLSAQGMKHLILDLQGNGGGYLAVAQNLVSMFIQDGKIITYTKGAHQPTVEDYRSQPRFFDGNGAIVDSKLRTRGQMRDEQKNRIVVLVDESSASASEITTGALQDWDRAVIVGRRTFGKGLVQKPIKLQDGSEIRLTISRYYTPSGRCIQKPYEADGKDEYKLDLEKRYNHGEYLHEDSIHFPDSLKYKTMQLNRTVYGGGGIMPDVFVPLDTTYNTAYYRAIIGKGLISKFSIRHLDKHRDEIMSKYKTFADFDKKYEVTDDMIAELRRLADEEKIEFKQEEFDRSLAHIRQNIKGNLASDIWDRSCYFQIINRMNPIFREGVRVISDPTLYQESFKDRGPQVGRGK